MPISKLDARELMSRGFEMGTLVLNGTLERDTDGSWSVEGRSIDEWLSSVQGQEVIILAAPIHSASGTKRLCRVCGSEYEGYECPRCRQARQRLRARG